MNFQAVIFILLIILAPVFAFLTFADDIGILIAKQPSPYVVKWGPDNARVKIVHFSDYTSNGSRRIYKQLVQLKGQNPDIQIMVREFPQSPLATNLAKMAVASAAYNMYQDAHNRLMLIPVNDLGNKPEVLFANMNLIPADLKAGLTDEKIEHHLLWNKIIAKILGVDSPPLLIVNNRVIDHDAYDLTEMNDLIRSENR